MPERLQLSSGGPAGVANGLGACLPILAVLLSGAVFPSPSIADAPPDPSSLSLPAPEKEGLRDVLASMKEAGFPAEGPRRLLDLAAELASAGISTRDLSSKAREGIAKRVGYERVMSVMGERVSRLKEARLLVLDLSSEGTDFLDQQMAYQVVADYLSRGIPPEDLRRMVRQRSLEEYPALENVIR